MSFSFCFQLIILISHVWQDSISSIITSISCNFSILQRFKIKTFTCFLSFIIISKSSMTAYQLTNCSKFQIKIMSKNLIYFFTSKKCQLLFFTIFVFFWNWLTMLKTQLSTSFLISMISYWFDWNINENDKFDNLIFLIWQNFHFLQLFIKICFVSIWWDQTYILFQH